jgi:hypothetical protein
VHELYPPDLIAVFGTVRGEFARTRNIEDGHLRPALRVDIRLADASLAFEIGGKVRAEQIGVVPERSRAAVASERSADRFPRSLSSICRDSRV